MGARNGMLSYPAMPVPAQDRAKRAVRQPLTANIAAAVRRSLNMPRLRVEARRVRSSTCDGWRVTLHERRRASEAVLLDAPAIAVIKKIGLVPPEYHGDLRIALAGIREDWRGYRSTRAPAGR